ncbi:MULTISPECIES: Maf family nucleotide pyrophosphatase [unclassified Aureispira]|uniref:Maf family nucleotide pyrophosphatase n=1 Tax=unclassified Aureispira TaxID=2649989 RepID=UPI0006976262|nr:MULTISPECIES: Maf family nucleotide pyrophosphatase [unclassified Aureispira]WMX13011.1 Maf family nucleotide pyrophosphatase [Aureispira sp. CCB-E]
MQKIKPSILLASKSPRRKQLLTELGFEFEVVLQDIVEDFPEELQKKEVPAFLAQQKANAVRTHLTNGKVILASDTIVLLEDTIYHKPKDYEDAVRILTALSGKVHQVITGVCLLSLDKEVVFSDVANVHFAPLSRKEIDYYIHNYQPYDKAGAYAIQEWIGLAKIIKIDGAYNSIVGLPTQKVYEALMSF